MVEQKYELNAVFSSLSDPTRRDILKRISGRGMSVGEIAARYKLTFSGIAKHLSVLERAKLITKNRRGKEQIVTLSPSALAFADAYLENFSRLWDNRLNSLDKYLKTISAKGGSAGFSLAKARRAFGGNNKSLRPAKSGRKGKKYGTN